MIRTLLALALLLLSACSTTPPGASETPNTLSAAEQRDGYELLFDGESTEHWRGYKKAGFPQGWVVQDGTLARVESGGDIVTREQYESFELALEWKISPGGNSGIFWHVLESDDLDSTYQSGPEMQVLDNVGHPGIEAVHSAGACYELYAPEPTGAHPVGEWNEVRLRVDGNHVEQWLNGAKVCDYEMGSDDWNRRVQASKFASMPRFAQVRRGRIALQDHGDPVWFRNLRIRRL